MVDFARNSIRYSTSLFAYDNGNGVELLGNSDGRTVAQTEVGVDVEIGRHREDATCSQYGLTTGYDCAVVEGRVFEEQRLEEGRGNGREDRLAGVDDVGDVVLAGKDDEGSGLTLRHVHTSLYVGVEIDGLGYIGALSPPEDAFTLVLGSYGSLGAHEKQQSPYFRLEYDDQGDDTYRDKLTQNLGQ